MQRALAVNPRVPASYFLMFAATWRRRGLGVEETLARFEAKARAGLN